MDNSIYWNINKLLSYNALFYFVIGERGVGKSYGAKLYVANKFIKKGEQFVYIRRYKTELKTAMMKNSTPVFFEQIADDPKMEGHKFKNTKDTMYIDGKICGYAIPLSVANILKSSTYERVTTIIFDEFILDKGTYHYLQDEVTAFLETFETINRLREVKVLFLGNAISITNPYFTYFNLTLPYNSEFKTFKNGLIVVNYIKNIKYREVKKQTKFGRLIENTEYGKYAIDNEFLRDSKYFIKKKTKTSKFFFIMKLGGRDFGIWIDYNTNSIFISNDYDPLCPIVVTINPNDHNETTLLVKIRNNSFFKNLIEHYRQGLLFFENQMTKNIVLEYISKYLTY